MMTGSSVMINSPVMIGLPGVVIGLPVQLTSTAGIGSFLTKISSVINAQLTLRANYSCGVIITGSM